MNTPQIIVFIDRFIPSSKTQEKNILAMDLKKTFIKKPEVLVFDIEKKQSMAASLRVTKAPHTIIKLDWVIKASYYGVKSPADNVKMLSKVKPNYGNSGKSKQNK